jgi:GAF domain
MHSRGIRLALAIVFVLAMLAAAYQIFTTYTSSRAALAALTSMDTGLDAFALGIADLRASQQAYVAAGQGEGYWISRVSERLASLRADLSGLAGEARSSEARARLKGAAGQLEEFEQMDRRTREYARGGQRLLASDVIFADGLEITRAVQEEVAAARAAERVEAETVLAAADRRQIISAAGIAAAALFVVFLLVRPVPVPAVTPVRLDAPDDLPSSPDILGLALDPERARADHRGPRRDEVAGPVEGQTPGGVESPELSKLEAPDMTRAADLCVELARVQEPRQLAALLERTAELLDAAGVIVWMADPDRRELVPTLTHGYPPAALARFGTIPRDADNATAAAFREGMLKTVAADGPASGAIVAPLVTPSGCVGVIAAEVSGERERDATTRALARIIAAQIAALLGAPTAAVRTPRAAEA